MLCVKKNIFSSVTKAYAAYISCSYTRATPGGAPVLDMRLDATSFSRFLWKRQEKRRGKPPSFPPSFPRSPRAPVGRLVSSLLPPSLSSPPCTTPPQPTNTVELELNSQARPSSLPSFLPDSRPLYILGTPSFSSLPFLHPSPLFLLLSRINFNSGKKPATARTTPAPGLFLRHLFCHATAICECNARQENKNADVPDTFLLYQLCTRAVKS